MNRKDEKTEEVYAYLLDQWRNHGNIPTYREIADASDLSVTGVRHHLEKLYQFCSTIACK